MILALVAVGLAAATWLSYRARPLREAAQPAAGSGVSVVVPARDEATHLPVLLASLARLDPAPQEVIVVDDDSTDATAAVAAAHGARVISTAPEPGWLGKPWACHVGAAAASGTHLVFLDADTCLAPTALGALLAAHHQRGGLVSVAPYHVTGAWYEELSSYPNAVSVLGSGAFAPADPAPAAFGPCLVTTTADYVRAGGHEAIRNEVVDDLHLARRYHDAGLPVSCLLGGRLVRYRMYPDGLGQLVDGWTKNLAAGAGLASRLAVAGTVVWIGAHAALVTATATGLVRWAAGTASAPVTLLVASCAVALHQRWLLARLGSFRLVTALAFPVPLAAFLVLFTRSAVVTLGRGRSRWRGRAVPVAARGRG